MIYEQPNIHSVASERMDNVAAWTVVFSSLLVFSSGVEGTARTCYFGPPLKPDPDNPEHWTEQVMREIREHCPGKRGCSQAVECSNPRPLGMEDGTIRDEQISASSSDSWGPAHAARLNYRERWAPMSNNDSWIEVNLGDSMVVSGVITQGNPTSSQFYVRKYKVSYQEQPSSDLVHVTDGNGNAQVFIGNNDRTSPVANLFDESVVATVVRIEPTEWNLWISLRLELLGCQHD